MPSYKAKRSSSYRELKGKIRTGGITFPMTASDDEVTKFEIANRPELDIRVHILGCEQQESRHEGKPLGWNFTFNQRP